MAQTAKKYKCLYCNNRYSRNKLVTHIDRVHEDMIPEGYTSTRLVFDMANKNVESCGHCRICGRPTTWNESAGRYNVICERESCRRKYKENLRKNIIRVKKVSDILTDPDHQKEMMASRKISGMYEFSDGGEVGYMGQYEKKFLKFCDEYAEIPSWDISQGPVFEYEYDGKTRQYFSDYIYIPYNLIIEIKDGGEHPNTMRQSGGQWQESGEKTIAKEKIFTENGEFNYVRITDNQFYQFIEILMDMKYKILINDTTRTISINDFTGGVSFEEMALSEGILDDIKYSVQGGSYLYRITYNGEGIYEAYKKKCSPNEWQMFINSPACRWLPKPSNGCYIDGNKYESYFSELGLRQYTALTHPIISMKIPNAKIERVKTKDLSSKYYVAYYDEYQVVYNVSKQIKESADVIHELSMFDRKNLLQLNIILNKYGYGYIVNGKVIQDFDLFYQYYKTIPVKVFEKYKVGVCWDYVNYESYWLRKNNIPHRCYFFIQNNQELATHTFLIFEDNGKYYYFESSWKDYAGIWQYDSIKDILDDVIKRSLALYKPDRKIDEARRYYAVYEYFPFGTDQGWSCDKFMKYCGTSRLVTTNNEEFAVKWVQSKCEHLIISVHEAGVITEDFVDAYDYFDKNVINTDWQSNDIDIKKFKKLPAGVKIYHGSPTQNLKYLLPDNKSINDDVGNMDLVYASPKKEFAACFGTRWHDGMAHQYTINGVTYFDITDRLDLDSPCSLYELENDGEWYYLPSHKSEVVRESRAKVKKETKYRTFKEMLEKNKINVGQLREQTEIDDLLE